MSRMLIAVEDAIRDRSTPIAKRIDKLQKAEVLADAFEEYGDHSAATRTRELIKIGNESFEREGVPYTARPTGLRVQGFAFARRSKGIRTILDDLHSALKNLSEPRRKLARVKRIYHHYRRKNQPAQEAFGKAKRFGEERRVGWIGDLSWPDEDGGPIIREPDGSYRLEYVQQQYVKNGKARKYRIYRVDLDRFERADWADFRGISETADVSPGVLRHRLASRNPQARARAIEDIANYHGWENFDNYPLEVTRRELRDRYRR